MNKKEYQVNNTDLPKNAYMLEFDQISSSSKVELEMHTETAFHPYMPNYVLLLCMRGDITAETTYSLLEDILENLS